MLHEHHSPVGLHPSVGAAKKKKKQLATKLRNEIVDLSGGQEAVAARSLAYQQQHKQRMVDVDVEVPSKGPIMAPKGRTAGTMGPNTTNSSSTTPPPPPPAASTFSLHMDGHSKPKARQRRLLDELSNPPPVSTRSERLSSHRSSSVPPKVLNRSSLASGGAYDEETAEAVVAAEVEARSVVPPSNAMFMSKLAAKDIAASAKRSRSRLTLPKLVDTSSHSPAAFMTEITKFVESELSQLERRFPQESTDFQRAPRTTLLPSEIALRRAGVAPETVQEKKRALRLEIFSTAQQMFSDSFKTYQLFLNAIAEEHNSYAQFLREDLQLHKEVVAGMRAEMENVKLQARNDVAAAQRERDEVAAELQAERDHHKRMRMAHAEAAMKEKNQESDVRRQLLELEHSNGSFREENKRLKAEIDALLRQVDTLSLTTFSDALEQTNHSLLEWKTQAAAKEDLVHEAHDQIADLVKDLKNVTAHFHNLLDLEQHLTVKDVKLGVDGLRALFPEAAAERRKSMAAAARKKKTFMDESVNKEANQSQTHAQQQGAGGVGESSTTGTQSGVSTMEQSTTTQHTYPTGGGGGGGGGGTSILSDFDASMTTSVLQPSPMNARGVEAVLPPEMGASTTGGSHLASFLAV